jgi:tRNA(His) 5'-end guanylyltransferase
MPVNDQLGIRMKEFYESVPKSHLMRRTPVALRLDGKAFHTFTRGFMKPFDEILIKSMQETMQYLCKNIQGCVLGYTQSDEITLILLDYQTLDTEAWFGYEVQKMCSVAASMATLAFNQSFYKNVGIFYEKIWDDICEDWRADPQEIAYYFKLFEATEKGAMFDCRCFNIPKEEVANLIYWRQLDATRNSIQMVGQANFSHKELQNKSCNEIQDMLFTQKGINWNDFPICQKRGSCCVRKIIQNPNVDVKDGFYPRNNWVIDTEIPIFKGEGRQYIDNLIFIGD